MTHSVDYLYDLIDNCLAPNSQPMAMAQPHPNKPPPPQNNQPAAYQQPDASIDWSAAREISRNTEELEEISRLVDTEIRKNVNR